MKEVTPTTKRTVKYSIENNKRQYLLKENNTLVGVAYSLAKAKELIEHKLDRYLDSFACGLYYTK